MLKTQFDNLSLKDTLYYQKLEKELSKNAKKIVIIVDNIIRNDRSKNYNVVKNKLKKVIKKAWGDNWRKGLSDSARKITLTYEFEDDPEEIKQIESSLGEIEKEDDDDAEEKQFERGKFYKIYLSRRADILADRLIKSNREALAKIAAEDPKYRGKLELINKFLDPKKSQKLTSKERKQLNDLVSSFSSRRKFRALVDKDASRIARTEISAAYNFSRLEACLRQGVKYVKWQNAIENVRAGIVCPICKERNGLVFEIERALNDPELQIPSHPNCACFWEKVTERKEKLGFREKNKFRNSIIGFTLGAAGLAGGYLAEAFRASRPVIRYVATPDRAYAVARAIRGDVTAQQVLLEDIKKEVEQLPVLRKRLSRRQKRAAKRIADYLNQLKVQKIQVRKKYAGNWLKQQEETLKIEAEILKLRRILGEITAKYASEEITQNKLQQAWLAVKKTLLNPPRITDYEYQADLSPLPELGKKLKERRVLNLAQRIDKAVKIKLELPRVLEQNNEIENKLKVDLDSYAKNIEAAQYSNALLDLDSAILKLQARERSLNEIYTASLSKYSELEVGANDYLTTQNIDLEREQLPLLESVIKSTKTARELFKTQRAALNALAKNQATLKKVKSDRSRLFEELIGGNAQAQYRNVQKNALLQINREINSRNPEVTAKIFDFATRVIDGSGVTRGYSSRELNRTLLRVRKLVRSKMREKAAEKLESLIGYREYYELESILLKYKKLFDEAKNNSINRNRRFKQLDIKYSIDNINSLLGATSLSASRGRTLRAFLESVLEREKKVNGLVEQIDKALLQLRTLKQFTPSYKLLTSKRVVLPERGIVIKDRIIDDRFINQRNKRERQGITKRTAILRRQQRIAEIREELTDGILTQEEAERAIQAIEAEIEEIDRLYFKQPELGLLAFADPRSNLSQFG